MSREYCGYLPPIANDLDIPSRYIEFEDLQIEIPFPTSQQLKELIQRMKAETTPISLEETIHAIDQAVACLLDRTHPLRQKIEELLPQVTGYDSEMLRLGLTRFLMNFRRHELQRWLAEDFEQPMILEEFVPRYHGGFSRAFGPTLCANIWAGNVPALPLWSLVATLLVKGRLIGKVSSSEPSFIGLFCQLLVQIEPKFANKIAIISWQGGDKEREEALIKAADYVIAYGNERTMSAIQEKITPTSHFIAFGNKLSYGLIHHDILDSQKSDQLVHEAAKSIVYYDQQGCYSPQIYFVEKGGLISPREWAMMLSGELKAYQTRYPAGKLSLDEAYERAQWKEEKEWQGDIEVFPVKSSAWLVTYSEKLDFTPSPLSRVIQVIAVENWQSIARVLDNKASILQTVGIAAPTKDLFQMANFFGKFGVSRLTSLQTMTQVHPGWNSDGHALLKELVRLVDIDQNVLLDSERWNSYKD